MHLCVISRELVQTESAVCKKALYKKYLIIIPWARMGYWLRVHEGERNNSFGKIQLVDQKYRDKTTLAS